MMYDHDFELQRDRVAALADKWIKPLGLGYWTIDIIGKDGHGVAKNEGASRLFDCITLPEYLHAEIMFYAPVVENVNDSELEFYFVHELMHIFMAEIKHECDDLDWHVEHVCTRLAKAFLWAVENVGRGDGANIQDHQ